MTAQTRQWVLHLVLGGASALLVSLVHATADGSGITQHEALTAAETFVAYLFGAMMRSPADVRESDAQTRSTDPVP